MVSEGEDAPAVSLPAYVDGERRRLDLDEYVGEGIVVLAFYPADFNPACTMQASDLGDLDLFTMQKDVSVFAVSPDSTYSHEAFAERYGLQVPLLSDSERAAATAYDVTTETDLGERLVQRAVFVVDHRGVVQYAWATDDLETEIDVAPVKQAVGDIGGDDTAIERYRVGHDHYVEGREAFTAAMTDYEEREWLAARNGFEAAEPAFRTAADHFDTAVRFAETGDFEAVADRTEEKADTLSHAASWLADSADALASGRGKQGTQYREDAERLLDAAADLPEPPEPDVFTLSEGGIEMGDSVVVDSDDEGYDWRDGDGEPVGTDLGVDDADLDAVVAADAADTDERTGDADAVEGDLEMDLDAVEEADADGFDGESEVEGDAVEGDLKMDLDAVEEASADAPGESETTDAAAEDPRDGSATDGRSSGAPAADSEPLYRGGSTGDPSEAAASVSEAGRPATSGGEGGTPTGPTDSAGSGDGSDDFSDGSDDVEELDLADPTEGDEDDAAEDERADWDIPGR
ncbi:alkyl hydroperoxide reductase [Halobacteriales archaeon QH_8_67_27]|nr:MAG: alkyl hydroperoxide reductase [Halobacteriales archaeon QH_8_67_27]